MWRGCGEKGAFVHCWWECKLVQPLWQTMWKFFKKLKTQLSYDPVISLLGIYLKEMKAEYQKRYLLPRVYCIIIHNSQDMKTAQVSVNGWMDKEDVVYAYNEIFSHKKEINPPICDNMERPWRNYAKWRKSEKDKYYSIWCHLREESKKAELLKTV